MKADTDALILAISQGHTVQVCMSSDPSREEEEIYDVLEERASQPDCVGRVSFIYDPSREACEVRIIDRSTGRITQRLNPLMPLAMPLDQLADQDAAGSAV